MRNLTLFETERDAYTGVSTSEKARREGESSGRFNSLRNTVLRRVRYYPSSTVGELEATDGVVPGTYGRRMAELVRERLIYCDGERICGQSKRSRKTWRIVG